MHAIRNACIALPLLIASQAWPEDYVVRIDIGGFQDVAEEIAAPPETVRRSLELVCQPGVKAHCKVRFDNESLSFTALLQKRDDGSFLVGLDLSEAIDSGEKIPDGKGGITTRVDSTRAQTQTSIAKLGDTVALGGHTSTRKLKDEQPTMSVLGKLLSKQPAGKERTTKSKRMFSLTLEQYVPPVEDERALMAPD
jgi:hypothetical protein